MVIIEREEASHRSKFIHRGTLIEASHHPWSQFASLDTVPSAHSLRLDSIIADPSGRLAKVHSAIARHYAEPGRVRRRGQNLWEETTGSRRTRSIGLLAGSGYGLGVQDQLECPPAA